MSKILNISEALTIAIHSISLIAKSETPVNAMKIAELTGFSKNHISKVLQQLAKNNYLVSTRGPKGGFLINSKSDNANLLGIYKLFEGEIRTDYCKYECIKCPLSKCVFDDIVQKISYQFVEYLTNKKISDI